MNEDIARKNLHPTITYRLDGAYSYNYHEDVCEYDRYVRERHIDEFIEHALQVVTPFTRVRVTVEVFD